nr:armadillo-like helical domain-containing protein 2 [Lytechinus pictus]
MFKSVRRAVVQGVEKTWHTFASHGEGRGDSQWEEETNRFKREVLITSKDLGVGTDPDVMTDAIRRIGHLAWGGGPDAAKAAATFLDLLLGYLSDRETSIRVRTQIVRSLSEIYRGHRDHGEKFRSMGVITILADLLKKYNDSALLRWCCYTLFTLCAGSLVNVGLVEAHDLKENFTVLASLSWKGWPKNYAQMMLLMVGYAKEEDFKETTEEEEEDEEASDHPMPLKDILKGRRTAEMSVIKKKSLDVPAL